jgi:hypothetical protein
MTVLKNKKSKSKKIVSKIDTDIAELNFHLNKKREYIAILELELFNTRAILVEFSEKYNEKILPLEERLQELRRMVYEALQNQHINDPDNSFAEFGDEEDNQEDFYQDRDSHEWRRIDKNKAKKKLSPDKEKEIRQLFRQLAKRFHPDLTSDQKEKKWREEIMTKVNQAYGSRNLAALKALAEQPDRAYNPLKRTKKEKIAHLKQEIKRLDPIVADLKSRIRHLEESPAMRLKLEARLQRRTGNDLLTETADKLQEKINDLKERLLILGIDAYAEDQEASEKNVSKNGTGPQQPPFQSAD